MRLGRLMATLLGSLVLIPAHAAAQHEPIDKGTLLIGGSAGISGFHRDGDATSLFSISLAPTIGVFIVHGIAVSGSVSFGHSSDGATTVNTWGVGPSVAYYFPRVVSRAYPFVKVGSSFSWSFTHVSAFVGTQEEFQTHFIRLRPSAGLLFMLIQHVGIEGEFYLLRSWTNRDPDTFLGMGQRNTSTYGFSAGVTAFVF